MHIDMERLCQYPSYTQVFAAFVAPEYRDCAMERTLCILEKFHREAAQNGITVCKSYSDWENAKTNVKAFLSIEGGEAISSLADLERLYELGVRMIAPTWNFRNHIACGVMESEDTGLTPFGRELIREMNRLGIIIDVSHLSQKSFWDICDISQKPVCASHSNSRSVKNHPRNLTDEQFVKIKEMGGVVGINFYPPFLGDDISDATRHIERFLSLGGEDNIGLGSDFDGVDSLPGGMCGVQDMGRFMEMLPYSVEIKEKIAFRNFLRVIKAHNC